VLLVALMALAVVFILGLGYAILGEPYRPVFRHHHLSVPSAWPGLSIVHISDLHVRSGDQRLFRAQRAALEGLVERITEPAVSAATAS